MKLNELMGWVRAIVVIGYRRWRSDGGGWRGLWRWVSGGVGALAVGWRGAKVTEEVRLGRMEACRACPLYDERLRTCGSMELDVRTVFGWEPLGCGCFMPMKVAFAGSRCWRDERDPEARVWWDANQRGKLDGLEGGTARGEAAP
jgi:hypothetical protein